MGNFIYSAEGDMNGYIANDKISFCLNDAPELTSITSFLYYRGAFSRALSWI